MDEIRGKNKITNKLDEIYEDGIKLENNIAKDKFFEAWIEIYKKIDIELNSIWNNEIKNIYIEENNTEKKDTTIDHADLCKKNEIQMITKMKMGNINQEIIEKKINNLKIKKAPGPDGITSEILKYLIEIEECKKYITESYENIMNNKKIPKEWYKTKTKMIEKNKKPTKIDFRPLALADITCKIYMSYIKDEIINHIEKNELNKENQQGFTEGGRLEYNHMILQYIVEKNMKETTENVYEMPTLYWPIEKTDFRNIKSKTKEKKRNKKKRINNCCN